MKRNLQIISSITIFSILTIFCLFLYSKDFNNHKNGFNRTFLSNPIIHSRVSDIKYDSYYISGITSDHVFLGNVTAPLHLLITNALLTDTHHIRLKIHDLKKLNLKSIRVTVDSPYFYATDYRESYVLGGMIGSWEARILVRDSIYLKESISVSPVSFVGRQVKHSMESVLAKRTNTPPYIKLAPDLLQKQVDGYFCTDGMVHYNKEANSVIYVYFYRNQFICADSNLNLLYRANTIDTTSKVKIKVANIESEHAKTMGAPPATVNKKSWTSGKLLFINSNLIADNEEKENFKESSVIDVYSLDKIGKYLFSFYIPKYKGLKMNDFQVLDKRLVAIYDHYLVIYELNMENQEDKQITEGG